jgi:hypothetical protein
LQGGALLLSAALLAGQTAPNSVRADVSAITAWVKIGVNNAVTLIASQSEMGQGIATPCCTRFRQD